MSYGESARASWLWQDGQGESAGVSRPGKSAGVSFPRPLAGLTCPGFLQLNNNIYLNPGSVSQGRSTSGMRFPLKFKQSRPLVKHL